MPYFQPDPGFDVFTKQYGWNPFYNPLSPRPDLLRGLLMTIIQKRQAGELAEKTKAEEAQKEWQRQMEIFKAGLEERKTRATEKQAEAAFERAKATAKTEPEKVIPMAHLKLAASFLGLPADEEILKQMPYTAQETIFKNYSEAMRTIKATGGKQFALDRKKALADKLLAEGKINQDEYLNILTDRDVGLPTKRDIEQKRTQITQSVDKTMRDFWNIWPGKVPNQEAVKVFRMTTGYDPLMPKEYNIALGLKQAGYASEQEESLIESLNKIRDNIIAIIQTQKPKDIEQLGAILKQSGWTDEDIRDLRDYLEKWIKVYR